MRFVNLVCNAALMLLFFRYSFAAVPESPGMAGGGSGVMTPGLAQGIGGALSGAAGAVAVTGPAAQPEGSQDAPPAAKPELPVAPVLPPAAVPKGLTKEEIHEFGEQVEEVRKVYQSILAGLERDAKQAEINYANQVIWCEKVYAGYSPHSKRNRDECNKNALRNFEDTIKKIKENMQGAVTAYNQAIQNIKEAIAKEAGVTADELPTAPDLSKPIDSLCLINGVWQLCTAAVASDKGKDVAGNDICKINGVWQPCAGVGVGADKPGSDVVPVPGAGVNTGAVPGTGADVGAGANTGSTSTTTTTTTTTNNNAAAAEFKDLNDFADYCRQNPKAAACAEFGEAEEPKTGFAPVFDELKRNGEGMIKPFKWDKFLGGGGNVCPAPLVLTVRGNRVSMPFDLFCDFLRLIRPVVVMSALVVTGFLVLKGVK